MESIVRNTLAALLAPAWLSIPVCAQTLSYDHPWLTGIGVLNPDLPNSGALGVSANGRVAVGLSGLRLFEDTSIRWTPEDGLEDLGWLFTSPSYMWGASGTGRVLVGHSLGPRGLEGHIWTRETGMVGIDDLPGGNHSSALGSVSRDGTIMGGVASDELGGVAILWTHADGFLIIGELPGGGYHASVQDITPDGQRAVGRSQIAGGTDGAFLWTPEQGMVALGDLQGGDLGSAAYDISADGKVIVGKAVNSDLYKEAFRWTEEGGMVGLGDLPGSRFQSTARACNADGSVIVGDGLGFDNDGGGNRKAFIWTEEDGMRPLVEVLETDYGVETGGWILLNATDISADGRTIVGWGYNPEGTVEGFVAYLGPLDCRADINGNGVIDRWDWLWFFSRWEQHRLEADWNYDGRWDTRDLLAYLNDYVAGCD